MNHPRPFKRLFLLTTIGTILQLACGENSPRPGDEQDDGGAGAATSGTANAGRSAAAAVGGAASGSPSGGSSGATIGTAGSMSNGEGKLGARCTQNADCSAELSCIAVASNALADGGPAGGLCSAACVQGEATCERFGPNSACVYFGADAAFCLEGCSLGLTTSDKCHGRAEMGCASVYDADQAPSTCAAGACADGFDCVEGFCFARAIACLPQCNSDEECGAGLHCDRGTAFGGMGGKCRQQPAAGDATGTPCSPEASTCRGSCVELGHGSVCADGCSLGAAPACGATAANIDAACLYKFGDEDAGDAAACVRLCDCDDDCAEASLHCVAFAADSPSLRFGRAGYCEVSDGSPGLACQ